MLKFFKIVSLPMIELGIKIADKLLPIKNTRRMIHVNVI